MKCQRNSQIDVLIPMFHLICDANPRLNAFKIRHKRRIQQPRLFIKNLCSIHINPEPNYFKLNCNHGRRRRYRRKGSRAMLRLVLREPKHLPHLRLFRLLRKDWVVLSQHRSLLQGALKSVCVPMCITVSCPALTNLFPLCSPERPVFLADAAVLNARMMDAAAATRNTIAVAALRPPLFPAMTKYLLLYPLWD